MQYFLPLIYKIMAFFKKLLKVACGVYIIKSYSRWHAFKLAANPNMPPAVIPTVYVYFTSYTVLLYAATNKKIMRMVLMPRSLTTWHEFLE